ncbi:DUF5063 domain-containing protein [Qipengyuania sp. YIM B01966]|uniref:DUF5063 domain-containing protein n=1 Tax=Qipengyuania sp. YIM B01966 TaxID=2778646 RepID=UPI002103911E|nr:DUF5063 domain-containing protein [Qipengyuania sp. YIM B01966]
MTSPPTASMVNAINGYLALLKSQPDDEETRLAKLCEALDCLVIEYHRAPDVEPDTDDLLPSVPYEPLAERAAASFPELGYYADVEPQDGLEQEVTLGGAVDDLADIARDLSGVLWHIDRGAANDAYWEFRFGYQTHWGMHLRRLRRYLHSIMH